MTSRCAACGDHTDPAARFCPSCGAPSRTNGASTETRKTVTVLFADIAGSTQLGERLDPEAVRSLLARHFAEARTILERHGATVEKFIGDAVMVLALKVEMTHRMLWSPQPSPPAWARALR